MKHLNITVTGLVQGVYFRVSTRDEARRLGIRGFARNMADGSVYIEAEGDDEMISVFLDWLAQGPPAARVTDVVAEEGKYCDFAGFEVRY